MIQVVIHAETPEGSTQRTLTLGLNYSELRSLMAAETLRVRLDALDAASDVLTDVVLVGGPSDEQMIAEMVAAGLLDDASAHRLAEGGTIEGDGVGSPHLGR